jgi:Cu/Ag efflux pump CusA
VLSASIEVRAPVVYATFVLALTMMPVLFLSGLQGAFFAPLAASFLLATLASLLVAITLTPALALLLLGGAAPPDEPALLSRLKQVHEKWLETLCRRAWLSGTLTTLIGVAAVAGFFTFGAELLPAFRERHYVLQVNGPSGASIAWTRSIGERITRDLLAIDGIATVEQQIGRTEVSEDTFPPNRSEFHVELGPVDGKQEDAILERIRFVLGSYPGIQSEALTFLGDRIGESLSGETAAIAISAFGPDLDVLDRVASAIATTIRKIAGATDVQIRTTPGAPTLIAELDPLRASLRGVSTADVHTALETAYQGRNVAQIVEGSRIAEVAVILSNRFASDPEAAGQITVRGANGELVPLGVVAAVRLGDTRSAILHDGGRRRQIVTANSAVSDIAGLTRQIKNSVSENVSLPAGVYLEYSGAAEGQLAARRELFVNVAIAGIGIVAMLIMAFGGARPAVLILTNAPTALAGGVVAVLLSGGVMSLGALVGFVTLFGIAARNSILLVSHVDHLINNEGASWGVQTVLRAARERVVPILMTALVTGLGMVPLALGSGEAGREVQGPMAGVILGGLTSSTVLSLLLLPPLILAWRHRSGTAR